MYFNVALSLLLSVFFVSANKINEIFHQIDDQYMEELVKHAEVQLQKSLELESKAIYLNPYVVSAEARHQLKTCPAYHRDDVQNMLEIITSDLVTRYNLDKLDVGLLRTFPLQENEITRQLWINCVDMRPVNCTDTKYPSIDGSCNNLDRPNEGRTFSCLDRFLPPDYADGVDAPRTCRNCPLPEPRTITIEIHRTARRGSLSKDYSSLIASFGQFLDHDIEFTTQPTTENNSAIACCNGPPLHPSCFPIEIFPNDPDFVNLTCLNFVRDARCVVCQLGWREQMNSLPPGLQCSQVYGSSIEQSRTLRKLDGSGELAVRMTDVGELPLANENTAAQCNSQFPCFLTGDFRSNQNLQLSTFHIIYVRIHNMLARQLKNMNRHWNEETLFQETRYIVICIFQHIVYTEYLPLIIGSKMMRDAGLDRHYTRYNPEMPLTLFNGFTAAGFRLHSLTPEKIFAIDCNGILNTIYLKDSFFNVTHIYLRGIEDLIRGGTRQPAENFDQLLARALTIFLYRQNTSLGLDLASINIQRGRDHGLPAYTSYVEYFHGFKITTFSDLVAYNLMDECTTEKLEKVYKCVECIDLFTGLISELRLPDAVVGPTAALIIARQFQRLMYGFRHFYRHRGQLSLDKLNSIYQVTLSRIFCDASDNLHEIAINPFLTSSPTVSCDDYYHIPPIDLTPWKE